MGPEPLRRTALPAFEIHTRTDSRLAPVTAVSIPLTHRSTRLLRTPFPWRGGRP